MLDNVYTMAKKAFKETNVCFKLDVDVHPCLAHPCPYVHMCPFSLDLPSPSYGHLLWMTPNYNML